jgi:YgiT-type zinc finger domain-containing protein
MNGDAGGAHEFCDGCHIGSLRPYRATYARWHDGQFVVVQGVPAWRCDYCGDTFYDDEALSRLALLLGPESDMEDQRRWRATGLDEDREVGLGNRRRV